MIYDNRLPVWRDLFKKKFMEKYKVYISSKANVFLNNGDSYKGSSGHTKEDEYNKKGTFRIKFEKVNIP
jgi:hypothetical protein